MPSLSNLQKPGGVSLTRASAGSAPGRLQQKLPTQFFWQILSHTGFLGEGDLEVERNMFSFTSKYNKKELDCLGI